MDRRFIQQQVGHESDSSLAIYTHVSDDFMNGAFPLIVDTGCHAAMVSVVDRCS